MPERNFLFICQSLESQLCDRQQQVPRTVDDIPENQFLTEIDQKLIDHVVSNLTVKPIILHEEDKKVTPPQAVKVNMSHDPILSTFARGSEPLLADGTQVIFNIPFSGEKWIFEYKTNQYYSSLFPCAEIKDEFIQIKIELPNNSKPEDFESKYEKEIKLIREYIEYGRTQIDVYNESLSRWVQKAIKDRRNRLDHHSNIANYFKGTSKK